MSRLDGAVVGAADEQGVGEVPQAPHAAAVSPQHEQTGAGRQRPHAHRPVRTAGRHPRAAERHRQHPGQQSMNHAPEKTVSYLEIVKKII